MNLEEYEPYLYLNQHKYEDSYIKENLKKFEKEVLYEFSEDFKKIIYKYDGASFMVNGFDCSTGYLNEFFGFLSFCKENKYNIWDTISRKWNDEEFKKNYVAFSYDKNFDVICFSKKDNSIWLFDKNDKTYTFLSDDIVNFIKSFYSTMEKYEYENMEAQKYFKYDNVKDQLIEYIGNNKNKYNRKDFDRLLKNKYKAIKLEKISELNKYIRPFLEYDIPNFDKKNVSDLTNDEINSNCYDIYFISDKEVIKKYYISKRSGYKCLFDYIITEYDSNDNIINFYSFRNISHLNAEIKYFLDEKNSKEIIVVDKKYKLK